MDDNPRPGLSQEICDFIESRTTDPTAIVSGLLNALASFVAQHPPSDQDEMTEDLIENFRRLIVEHRESLASDDETEPTN